MKKKLTDRTNFINYYIYIYTVYTRLGDDTLIYIFD